MKRIRILAGILPQLEGQLRDYVSGQSDMDLVCCTPDGFQVLQELQSAEVHVVVIELVIAGLDALGVLHTLSQLDLPNPPSVLVVTPTGNEWIARRLFEAGAAYCMMKPFALEVLGSRIRHIAVRGAQALSRRQAAPSTQDPMGGTEAVVAKLVREIGVPSWTNGYRYLCRAVGLVVRDESLLGAVTKIIYPTVAQEHASTPARVERSIRHAIKAAWTRGDPAQLREVFGPTRKRRPTNAEFIAVLADWLRTT